MMLTMIDGALLALLLALQVGDWWTTTRILAAPGGRELNRLDAWLFARFGSANRGLIAKGVFVVLIGLAFLLFAPPVGALIMLVLANVAYLYAVIHNLLDMRKSGLL